VRRRPRAIQSEKEELPEREEKGPKRPRDGVDKVKGSVCRNRGAEWEGGTFKKGRGEKKSQAIGALSPASLSSGSDGAGKDGDGSIRRGEMQASSSRAGSAVWGPWIGLRACNFRLMNP
jgi:hypothetical protein